MSCPMYNKPKYLFESLEVVIYVNLMFAVNSVVKNEDYMENEIYFL